MFSTRMKNEGDIICNNQDGKSQMLNAIGEEKLPIIRIIKTIDIIPSPNQSRRAIKSGELEELSHSIKCLGIKQPILLREIEGVLGGTRYELIAGERRWRASILAGIEYIPAIIEEGLSDEAAFLLNVTENIQRSNLSPLDEAFAYAKMASIFGYTHEKIANAVSKARSHITNLLRVLSLPEEVLYLIYEEKLTIGHAKLLVNKENCVELAKIASDKNFSVKELEKVMKNPSITQGKEAQETLLIESEMLKIQQSLAMKLGTTVSIRPDKIILKYKTLPQLVGILDKLNS